MLRYILIFCSSYALVIKYVTALVIKERFVAQWNYMKSECDMIVSL